MGLKEKSRKSREGIQGAEAKVQVLEEAPFRRTNPKLSGPSSQA